MSDLTLLLRWSFDYNVGMTYLSFLLYFVGVPILVFIAWQVWRPVKLAGDLSGAGWWKVIVGHVVVVLYV